MMGRTLLVLLALVLGPQWGHASPFTHPQDRFLVALEFVPEGGLEAYRPGTFHYLKGFVRHIHADSVFFDTAKQRLVFFDVAAPFEAADSTAALQATKAFAAGLMYKPPAPSRYQSIIDARYPAQAIATHGLAHFGMRVLFLSRLHLDFVEDDFFGLFSPDMSTERLAVVKQGSSIVAGRRKPIAPSRYFVHNRYLYLAFPSPASDPAHRLIVKASRPSNSRWTLGSYWYSIREAREMRQSRSAMSEVRVVRIQSVPGSYNVGHVTFAFGHPAMSSHPVFARYNPKCATSMKDALRLMNSDRFAFDGGGCTVQMYPYIDLGVVLRDGHQITYDFSWVSDRVKVMNQVMVYGGTRWVGLKCLTAEDCVPSRFDFKIFERFKEDTAANPAAKPTAPPIEETSWGRLKEIIAR